MTGRDWVVHPSALCESSDIGARTNIWAFAHVMEHARIGEDCNICDHVFVESGAIIGSRVTLKNNTLVWDGVTIEDDAFIGPNVVFTNDPYPRVRGIRETFRPVATRIGKAASIGANSTILCGVIVGEFAMVGAASVVTHDIPPYALVTGNPARWIGWVCRCGRRLADSLRCSCGITYEVAEELLKPSEHSRCP